ncbi:PAS domain S-box protein [Longimicrobium sp.]|uniref:PAS domain-containing sensor histidine kinase n=1 Tax=Longimicrobium sp. TaxID=2029185 RepID=UPI002CABF05D|nr:PAS domain S-box protein [Longimicrobium sp.]HSU14820.1 PAS domain S-box protein [Longimicrobium sp.]
MSEKGSWPVGGGETGALIRARDWSGTPLGPVEAWPPGLRTAVDIMLGCPQPTSVIWGPGHVQLYNDAYLPVAQDRHPAIFGARALESWPDARELLAGVLAGILAGGPAVQAENQSFPLRGAGGTADERVFTFTFSPVHDESGAVGGVFHHVVETTAAERARAGLRESEERFRVLVEATAQAVWETDDRGEVVADSPSWRAYTGQKPGEALGQGWLDAVHPDDRAYAGRQWREAVRAGTALDTEYRLRRADGGWHWTNVRAAPLRRPDGSVARWVGMNIDVTARREAEAALRESEERHRLIVAGARDYAILTFDPQGLVTSWSPGAEAVFGWAAAEALGQPIDITFTPEDRAARAPDAERALAARDGSAPDVRWHQRSDGSRVFIEGTTRALHGEDGGVRAFLKIGQDVTHRRRMDEALRELNETLERRVSERTAELARANEELRAARAELTITNEVLSTQITEREQASQARGELMRRLVGAEERERLRLSRELHDSVGQVVTALLLGLRALERDAGGIPARLGDLERLGEQIAREIHHVAAALRPPALDRLGLRRALEAHLEEWAARYGIACDFHAVGIDGERFEPEIETTLFRAVQEGLTNVARHAGAGAVNLVLERRSGMVGVILEDDGRGFDVEAGIEAAAHARRMGLLGIRERVGMLGGTVEIESAPGSGTTLFVRLPARAGRDEAAGEEEEG